MEANNNNQQNLMQQNVQLNQLVEHSLRNKLNDNPS